ncbi:MAG: nicotinate-nucleotide adenylyltransferase [Lachnospiraceae bacterium]|nr:nicotinate-nucleotide adenylyltransferase [Lachnospiraceae bacterium]
MKIGIIGGTFDPIHNGHLQIAENAYRSFALDKVIFIPSGCSYMKEHVSEAECRLAMAKLALQKYNYFAVSDIETKRPGNSYTFETLSELSAQCPAEYYYIIGADTLFMMEKWKSPEIIFELSTILVSVREGFPMDELRAKKDELEKRYQARIHFLPTRYFPYSSTEIRARVQRGADVSDMLADEVYSFIQSHKLYV